MFLLPDVISSTLCCECDVNNATVPFPSTFVSRLNPGSKTKLPPVYSDGSDRITVNEAFLLIVKLKVVSKLINWTCRLAKEVSLTHS